MKKILIFSGTTEGRRLAQVLSENLDSEKAPVECVLSVATEYGELVMPKLKHVSIHKGRLQEEEMSSFIGEGGFDAVVDATHPFATLVSEHIKSSMKEMDIPYLRLKRDTGKNQASSQLTYFQSAEECAKALEQTNGNILLTTGSKDLSVYAHNEELRERLFVRVLPGIESLQLCENQGIRGKHIIAMQGPFGVEMNCALIRQFDIKYLVTKESGASGGYQEKVLAAEKESIPVYVIGNPEKEISGYTFDEVCGKLSEILGQPVKNTVDFIGAGMGTKETMTVQAEKLIQMADYIFGAPRLLEGITARAVKKPYYLAKDIVPVLDKLSGRGLRIAVLFSGDTGFYSGCTKLYEQIKDRKDVTARIYPGISSISYMSGITGIAWNDAEIFSIHGHGRDEAWKDTLIHKLRTSSKIFLLTSGAKDVSIIGEALKKMQCRCRIFVGYQLSYPEEEILQLQPEQCQSITKEGLYTCLIVKEKEADIEDRDYRLCPGIRDDMFIRDKVPMTKEEVREISICKLGLQPESIVYDIGSGTGSIAVEAAQRSTDITVYAIEKKQTALELMQRNKEKFNVRNMIIIPGEAPEALESLPAPAHAFIGGSSGKLQDILQSLYQKNPVMRVVINAISLETIAEIAQLKQDKKICNIEIVQVQISRAKAVGSYQLMQAENPVYICSFQFQKEGRDE